ncbi:hypothetical protein [Bordetella genomosp. 10]|uniref:hypothetical protein n=1 Tax=Bordetella genomosp. 10 TaxID=1416804 RepID=UPI000B9DF70D|nr:hypothetical protein [Bordetella genomosp. 10]
MSSEVAGPARSPLYLSAPGMPPLHEAFDRWLGGLGSDAGAHYPQLRDEDALYNANGAPVLPKDYVHSEDARWGRVDLQVLLAAIDKLKATTALEQMDGAAKSLKGRINANETLRNTADAKRKEERERRAHARKTNLVGRVFGLAAQIVTTIGFGIALAASVVSGAGLLASPFLLAMFTASAMGVAEKSIQLAGNENFSLTGTLCAAVTAGLKTLDVDDELAEKLGNVIGSAIMVATAAGLINDPSAAGRLWAHALALVGVPKATAEAIGMVATVAATAGVVAFSFCSAAGAADATAIWSKTIARLGGSLKFQSVGVGADVLASIVNGVAAAGEGATSLWATWDTYEADKSGTECYRLQNQIKIANSWNSMEAENLTRVVRSYNEWRETDVQLGRLPAEALARATASIGSYA